MRHIPLLLLVATSACATRRATGCVQELFGLPVARFASRDALNAALRARYPRGSPVAEVEAAMRRGAPADRACTIDGYVGQQQQVGGAPAGDTTYRTVLVNVRARVWGRRAVTTLQYAYAWPGGRIVASPRVMW